MDFNIQLFVITSLVGLVHPYDYCPIGKEYCLPALYQPIANFVSTDQPSTFLGQGRISGCLCQRYASLTVCFARPKCIRFPIDFTIQTQGLRIVSTAIPRIESGELANLTHLTDLMIDANSNLSQIAPRAFFELNNLQNLSISYNTNLQHIENGTFEGLSNLRHLLLIKNGFNELRSFIPAVSGHWLPKLWKLELSENNFEVIDELDFVSIAGSTVEELNLILCQIETIHPKAFTVLTSLKVLRLGQNIFDAGTITKALAETIKAVELNALDLRGAGFRKRPPGGLIEVVSKSEIKRLSLDGNQFEVISSETFPFYLPKLEELDLREVLAVNITGGAFTNLPNLRRLLLGGNKLNTIPDGVQLAQLQYLDLKQNSGTVRKSDYFSIFGTPFIEMKSLKQLDLSYNTLHSVYNTSFTGLSNLTVLEMRNSSIFFIANYSFQHVSNLLFLNLENNPMVKDKSELEAEVFNGLEKLQVLLLGGCRFTHFQKLNPFRHLTSLTRLGLERNNLCASIMAKFPSLASLRILDLSSNVLSGWNDLLFDGLTNLQVLALADNKITYLSKAMQTDLENLTSLDLSNNPFSCACPMWRNTKIMRLLTNRTIFCSTTNVTLVRYLESDPCQLNIQLLVFVATFCLFLLVLTFVVLFHYRWYFKYWLFLARLNLARKGRLKNTKSDNSSYTYDAFVSYSSADQSFIIKLVTMLENQPPYLKLCLYERDFQIGTIISENVLESVKKSRRTLLVISDSYAKSNWCQWEAQMVQHHRLFFVTEGRYVDDSLILVKLGLNNEAKLSPTLRFLLKTRIYLEWDSGRREKCFWERLRNTLQPPKEVTHL